MVTWIDKELIAVIQRFSQLDRFDLLKKLIEEIREEQEIAEGDNIGEKMALVAKRLTELNQVLRQLQEEVVAEKRERIVRLKSTLSLLKGRQRTVRKEIARLEREVNELKAQEVSQLVIPIANESTTHVAVAHYLELLTQLEQRLIVQFIKKDRELANNEIYTRENYRKPVFSYVFKTNGSKEEGEETYAHGVCKLDEKIRKQEAVKESVGALLYGICKNHRNDEIRKRDRYNQLKDELLDKEGRAGRKIKTPQRIKQDKHYKLDLEKNQLNHKKVKHKLHEVLLNAVGNLQEPYHSMVCLRLNNYSWDEILEELPRLKDKKYASVYFHRAKKKLRKMIGSSPALDNLFDELS